MTGSTEDSGDDVRLPAARYANHVSVEFALSEVALRFGQSADPSSAPVVQSHIVCSPVDLVTFGHEIQAAISRYERLYGHIPDATGPRPDATRQ